MGACVCRALSIYLFFLPGNIRRRDVTCFNVLNQLSAMKTGRGCMQWSSTCASLKLAFLGLESSTSTTTIWILNGIFTISFESFCLLLFFYCFCLHSHFSAVLPVVIWPNSPIFETNLTKILVSWSKNNWKMTNNLQFLTKPRNRWKINCDLNFDQ